ncbi:MAG: transposase [Prosthecobacter sp.]|uniref:transposase n=1 Tax=Prosthecobacter sp. TaxID=1965333 RepID=UPI0038FE9D4D
MRFFNPHDDLLITQRKLPHWAQDGAVVFITWRTLDSMPQEVLEGWRAERNRWLVAHDIDPTLPGWKAQVQDLPLEQMTEYHEQFTTKWHEHLDLGHGACVLRQPELAQIVRDSLLYFDGDRYEMLDFVIMPNHVHLLACFPDKAALLEQCESWKHFTGVQINRRLGTKGRFWQQDAFDHLVRHEAQFRRLQRYIAENPAHAGLRSGEALRWKSSHHRSA